MRVQPYIFCSYVKVRIFFKFPYFVYPKFWRWIPCQNEVINDAIVNVLLTGNLKGTTITTLFQSNIKNIHFCNPISPISSLIFLTGKVFNHRLKDSSQTSSTLSKSKARYQKKGGIKSTSAKNHVIKIRNNEIKCYNVFSTLPYPLLCRTYFFFPAPSRTFLYDYVLRSQPLNYYGENPLQVHLSFSSHAIKYNFRKKTAKWSI